MIDVPNWPDDADGDVFRRLQDQGFDFSKPYVIDFNVEFDPWPPKPAALARLRERYPTAKAIPDEDGGRGYIQFKIIDLVSYELVIGTQTEVTALVEPFGGVCDSWGVLH